MRYLKLLLLVFVLCFCGACTPVDMDPFYSDNELEQKVEEHLYKDEKIEDEAYTIYDDRTDTVFSDTYNRLMNSVDDDEENVSLNERMFRLTYKFYSTFRTAAPFIGIGSFCVGLLIFSFCKKNKGMRKFALFGLMIAVPVMVIVGVFGLGYLIDTLLL